jgi:hypothetical protein
MVMVELRDARRGNFSPQRRKGRKGKANQVTKENSRSLCAFCGLIELSERAVRERLS